MACVKRSAATIQADIIRWEASLVIAKDTLDKILATPNEKNHFDDNEGSQSLTKRSTEDQMMAIEKIEDKLLKLRGELCGRSNRVTHINTRRISPGGYR